MQGASTGVVRYTAPDVLEKALKLADGDGKLEIAGITATLRKIEGECPCGFCVVCLGVSCLVSDLSRSVMRLPEGSPHARPLLMASHRCRPLFRAWYLVSC